MVNYNIDIKAKFIPSSVKIWRLFAGGSYVALSTFLEKNVVFLDLPGLQLPSELDENAPIPQLRERIAMSRAIQHWQRELDQLRSPKKKKAKPRRQATEHISEIDGPVQDSHYVSILVQEPSILPSHSIEEEKKPLTAPSFDINSYKSLSNKVSGSDIGAVQSFFRKAKAGDLIIVPDRYRNRRVYIGELLEDTNIRQEVNIPRYGEFPLLARKVHWFNPIDEGSLPSSLTKNLRIQNPMSLIDRGEYFRIFDEVYKNYYTDNEYCSRFYTTSEDFTASDSLYFNAFVRSISKMLVDVDTDADLDIDTILSLAFSSIPADYEASIACSIHSPGFLELKAGRITPLVVASLMALFWTGDAQAKPDAQAVTVHNSLSQIADDPCTNHVDKVVQTVLNRMNYPVWKEACEKAQNLKSSTGMRNSPSVRKTENDAVH